MPRGVRGRQGEVKGGERRREVREGEKGEKQEGERGRPLEQSQSQVQENRNQSLVRGWSC